MFCVREGEGDDRLCVRVCVLVCVCVREREREREGSALSFLNLDIGLPFSLFPPKLFLLLVCVCARVRARARVCGCARARGRVLAPLSSYVRCSRPTLPARSSRQRRSSSLVPFRGQGCLPTVAVLVGIGHRDFSFACARSRL